MRGCISSTPLASSFLKTRQNQRPRIAPARDLHAPPPSSSNPRTNICCSRHGGLRIVEDTSRATLSRATRLGSAERYEFYEDQGDDPFEVETSGVDLRVPSGKKEIEKRGKGSSDFVRIRGRGSGTGTDTTSVGVEVEVEVRGRQVMKRSSMIAKQVLSIESALSLGFVSQLWVDTTSWSVMLVEVRPNLLSGEADKFLLEDVSQVGDVVLVRNESVMANDFRMAELETLVGYKVATPGQQNMGKVRGYTFNIHSGAIESLELDSFGISIIPSSLVSTYALFVEDVLGVFHDTVVVHEAAASQIQRLTKGLWDAQNVKMSVDNYSEFERPVRSSRDQSTQRRFDSQKKKKMMKEIDEDWELPMDYL